MQLLEYEQRFAESLGHLLKRFCPEELLSTLSENLVQLRELELELVGKAKGARESDLQGARHIVETGHLENIITECADVLGKRELLQLLVELGSLCVTHGEFAMAKSLFTRVIDRCGSGTSFASLAGMACYKRAEIRIRQAHWNGVAVDLKKAESHFRKGRDSEGLAIVANSRGVQASEQGSLKKAAEFFTKAHASFEKSGNQERAAMSLMNLGIVATITGRWDEALAHYTRVLPTFQATGQSKRLTEVHHNMGMLYLAKGEYRTALAQFDDCVTHAQQMGYRAFVGLANLGKATAYARLEDYALSMVFAQKALTVFRQLNDKLSIADVYRIKGIIHRELNQPQLAELYLRTSVRLNEEYQSPLSLGEAYVELGRLYKRIHQKSEAMKAIRKAVASFKKIGAAQDIRVAQAVLAA